MDDGRRGYIDSNNIFFFILIIIRNLSGLIKKWMWIIENLSCFRVMFKSSILFCIYGGEL